MLERLVQFSLQYRLLVVAVAIALLGTGGYLLTELPVDVLPNLTRPRVTVITECPGMAPEEVETRVTIPLENALNGATDVLEVRSSSDIGLSVIQVELDWGQDIYRARQIVQERLVTATDYLPDQVQPQMAPMSSLLGQISVASPLGVALLGLREGARMPYVDADGTEHWLSVERVLPA